MTDFTPRLPQQAILRYSRGTMGISAVPGSGKTHTLSALAAQIIRSGDLGDEQEVLIVTLVNSAVDNFAARIKDFLGLPMPFGYRVRTLHGLAHDIVREKPAAAGLEERFAILDEREADFIRKEAVNAYLQANPDFLFANYLDPELDEYQRGKVRRKDLPELVENIANAFIRSAKDNRLTPERLRRLLDESPSLPLAEMGCEIYANYQRALQYRGAVDFDDLIRLALDLLENDEEYLERLRYRWPYVLEDEAQDSSQLQEQILRLLAGPEGNWVRVGDPNQAIFETFTTANPKYLRRFIAEEADTPRDLPESGRSQPSIIAMANALIDWVRAGHPAPEVRDALDEPYIRPTAPGDPQPNPPDDPAAIKIIGKKYTPEKEIVDIAESLTRWLPEHPDSTVAVLVPRNQRGVELIEALKQREVPFVEFLASTSSTRQAAGRLGEVVSALADPQSSAKLARAYLAWRRGEGESNDDLQHAVADLVRKCRAVEDFTAPQPGKDWLESLGEPKSDDEAQVFAELEAFRLVARRWHGTTVLPVDQMILTLAQDLFTAPGDLALAHKLALVLRQAGEDHADWRLPELHGELALIARNERRFIGFSDDDSGFDPSRHAGKVVVTTMHKAKGLEWDRVYLMSVNNYDFPSGQPNDRYISEKWFVRDSLNLEAETLAQLDTLQKTGEYEWYQEGEATQQARLDYVRERLRLLYVGITRAKRELVITWNTGRNGEQTPAIPLVALQGWLEGQK